MLDIVAQTTQAIQPPSATFDPFRWIGFIVGIIGVVFGAITITLTHVLWVRVILKNVVDSRPKEGHRRYLTLTVRNMGAEMPDVSVALVWVKDGAQDEREMKCIGDLPSPYKRNTSRNFYTENPDRRQSMEAEMMPIGSVWIEVRCGVIAVKKLKGKRYRAVIDAWSKPDPNLPEKPPPPERRGTGNFPKYPRTF